MNKESCCGNVLETPAPTTVIYATPTDLQIAIKQMQKGIEMNLLPSRDRSCLLTKLDEARMWAGECLPAGEFKSGGCSNGN